MEASVIISALTEALPRWLPTQRWFSSSSEPPTMVEVIESDWIVEPHPGLFWCLVKVDGQAIYQVPVGVRPEATIGATLLGHGRALIDTVDHDGERHHLYDALIDSALTKPLYNVICDDPEEVSTVRAVGAEQSNSSLVYDNRIICKVFRRMYEGSNPDPEITAALSDQDFSHVAPVKAVWRRGQWDLAMAQTYLYDGADGWNLALLSVRDFLRGEVTGSSSSQGSPNKQVGDVEDPAKAGGNFGNEAHRLGEVTATMHLALGLSFGTQDFDTSQLADSLAKDLDSLEGAEQKSLQVLIEDLRALSPGKAGKAGRTHGDFHFGQTLRSTGGWFVFDFEGGPARSFSDRRVLTSPMKDVAGMLRSLQYAAATGLSEQIESDQEELAPRAQSWEQHNRAKFRQGYLSVDGIDSLLPADGDTRDLVLRGFEVEKALYELAYEKAYRPDWVSIPQSALQRLLSE